MTWTFPDNPVALDDLLRANGIDTSQWGAGRSKTVADLWAEIVAGETRLRTQPFRREVLGVVEVIIRKGDHILIESCQTFQSVSSAVGKYHRRRRCNPAKPRSTPHNGV